jgi:hypothetical protein
MSFDESEVRITDFADTMLRGANPTLKTGRRLPMESL